MKRCDITGNRYGKLTVLKYVETIDKKAYWECICDCGETTIVQGARLKTGETKSCGCWKHEARAKHHLCEHRIYSIWKGMKRRCKDVNLGDYAYYGGKGIKVCDEWINNVQAFYNWAIANGYSDELTIDRIDNSKGYEPSNCRWATTKQQAFNTTRNRYVTYRGETKTITEWAMELGFTYGLIRKRLSNGWSVEKALETPIMQEYVRMHL
jgi:hypothetical protein